MEITTDSATLAEVAADVLIVGQWEDEPFDGPTAEVDHLLGGALSDAAGFADSADLSGKKEQLNVFFTRGSIASRRVAVVGLGKRKEATGHSLREASGAALRKLRERKVKTLATTLHSMIQGTDSAAVAGVAEGALLGSWEAGSYKAADSLPNQIDKLLLCGGADSISGAERGRILGESANLARDLVNEPPNELPPVALGQRAAAMASEVGLDCRILDEDEMYGLGMGGILAVSVGSENRAFVEV